MIRELINNEIERLSGKKQVAGTDKDSLPKFIMAIQEDQQSHSGSSPFKHMLFQSNSNEHSKSKEQAALVEKTKEIVMKSRANEAKIKDLERQLESKAIEPGKKSVAGKLVCIIFIILCILLTIAIALILYADVTGRQEKDDQITDLNNSISSLQASLEEY